MSYGTPDQMASLLASIKGNVSEEPEGTWSHQGVRVASRELADLLVQRLEEVPAGKALGRGRRVRQST